MDNFPQVAMPVKPASLEILKSNRAFIDALCTPGYFDHLEECPDCHKVSCSCDHDRRDYEERESNFTQL
jgi:hypothetical protein